MSYPSNTTPDYGDSEPLTLKKLLKVLDDARTGDAPLEVTGVTGGGTSAYDTTEPSLVAVDGTAIELAPANAEGYRITVMNNSGNPDAAVWVSIGSADPIADTGTLDAPNGNGKGIRIVPGALWQTDWDITQPVRCNSFYAASVTVQIFTRP